jgi:hypothetical protein
VAGVCRLRALAGIVSAGFVALLLGAAPAHAVPTCPGPDRTLCGGRIIPEPSGTTGFLTYAEWTASMQQLEKEHPDRVRFRQIGMTAGGRPLYDVMVSDFGDPTPLSKRTGLYFNGDIHGDERDGTEGFARAIEDLAESKDAAVLAKLRREVLVFTDANPDGWQTGDVPDGAGQPGPSGPTFTRENGAGHDLNREWPIVGFQNPTTFPLVDPEVQGIVNAHGNGLHRHDGIHFAYAIDVHGSATPETPPNAQLMLDVLLGADENDLTRTLQQVQMAETYMSNLSATADDNVLATIGSATGQQIYRVGDWDTSWDIYGYLVSGGYSDWMANSVTGLGAATGTVELWINGEPGQENTFAGYHQEIEASNVHSMRVAVATLMDLGMRDQQGLLNLPGRVAYVPNPARLEAGQGDGPVAPVGDAATRPPARPYPASTNRFWEDLGESSDHPIVSLDPGASDLATVLARQKAVVLTGDPQLGNPGFLANLKSYVMDGGTVVLTDGALQALSGLGLVAADAIAKQDVYAGYFDTTDPSSPLVNGRRPLSRQTYEPVPVGYGIDNTFSSATSSVHAPAWTVDQAAWEAAGGKTAGTTGSGRTSLGELLLGRGRIRILGALLPDPSGAFAHPFGVADYAVTYWGYRVVANLLDGTESLAPAAAAGCVDRRKFAFRIHQPRRGRVIAVAVYVNGKLVRRVHGRRIERVVVRRLPKGTFTLKIVARTSSGSETVSVRRYRGCTKGRPRTHVHRHPHR